MCHASLGKGTLDDRDLETTVSQWALVASDKPWHPGSIVVLFKILGMLVPAGFSTFRIGSTIHSPQGSRCLLDKTTRASSWSLNWVAVKELNLSYHNGYT